MKTNDIEAIYPLSPMQQGMLFHSLYEPESRQYMEQLSCRLSGDLDVPAFQKAWQKVVDRHAILRTAFAWRRVDQTLQAVNRRVTLPFLFNDLSGLPEAEQTAQIDAYCLQDQQKGFDLSRAPLMRVMLFKLSDRSYQWIWTHHHILLDGWSVPILIGEVLACYEGFRQGQPVELQAPRPYRDYILWLQNQDATKAEAFWRSRLAGFQATTPLGIDHAPVAVQSEAQQNHEIEKATSHELFAALQALARSNGLTTSLILQAAWAILLSRYSRENDVLFGMTFSGRSAPIAGIQEMVGLLINTLPIRVNVEPERALLPWLSELQERQAELSQYEYCSLIDIQKWSEVPASKPLFDSLFVFENYPVQPQTENGSAIKLESVHSIERTNYPIALIAAARSRLTLKVSYDPGRVDAAMAGRMIGHLETLLQAMAANPNQPIYQLPILTPAERKQILVQWNQTDAPYPQAWCAHDVFQLQVEHTPDAVALEFEGRSLTYRELDQQANRLARFLIRRGSGTETISGVLLNRSPEMIIAELAVLKAGGAFLPLDPTYPHDRLVYMLADSGANFLLTDAEHAGIYPGANLETICLDSEWPAIAQEDSALLPSLVEPDNLAYIIYTSGSTGTPKGTLLEHHGLVNLVTYQARDYQIGPGKRVLQFASAGFDASVAEIFTTLCSGGTLVLIRKEALTSLPELTRFLSEQHIHNVTLPPSLLAILPEADFPELEVVITAGEACPVSVANRWVSGRTLLNGYGPTETTVASAWYSMQEPVTDLPRLPIGQPLPNTHAYVLDPYLQPVPVGIPGELHVGGVGLARGYLNRPDLTHEKFIQDPFGAAGQRLYKTGDLVCWLPDGRLDFLGRVDLQVKLRGFRIELGEIESLLCQHPQVGQAAVKVFEAEGDQRLAAYIVLREPNAAVEPSALRDFLKEKLPGYMLPAAYQFLDALPLSASGKVNRKALPNPDGVGQFTQEDETLSPRTQTGEILAGIWSTVLNTEKVGENTDFFDAGGHSLLAMRVISRIRDVFQVEIPIRTLFENPTPAQMAQRIEALWKADGSGLKPQIRPVSHSGDIPLSFSQQRLWFLDQLEPGNPFYNLPAAMRLHGRLDPSALVQALQTILQRHEVLRTRFIDRDGRPVQIIEPNRTIELPMIDLSQLEAQEAEMALREETLAACSHSFNLAGDLLLRAILFKLSEQEHVLVLIVHHIVADGWSMEVLLHELSALYAGSQTGKVALPELPIQYADFACWQRSWLQGENLERQIDYWKKQLAGISPLLELPTDHPRPAVQSYHGDMLHIVLPAAIDRRLRAFCKKEGATLYMVLLALYQVLLYRYSGQEDIPVGSAIANRNQREIEPLIGFFVNTLVLRGSLAGEPSFRDLLNRTRKVCLDAYAHQDLPFEILVDALQPERDMSRSPLFQVAFDLQAQAPGALEIPGLQIEPLILHNGTASYDLLLSITDTGTEIHVSLEYALDLFDPSTVQRMIDHYQVLIEAALNEPTRSIAHLAMLTGAERQMTLSDWNRSAHPFFDGCAHELFATWVHQQPEAEALRFQNRALTYRALDHRANVLARQLRALGVTPETPVAIFFQRGFDLVTAALAVIKAGGAFLPLDPAYPPERLSFMLEDSQAPILLTHAPLMDRLPEHKARVVCLDGEQLDAGSAPALQPAQPPIRPDHLAYMIYTSGSTGKPKGTLLHHRGLCNLIEYQRCTFDITPGTRILQFSSASFDASVWEMFMALGNGATLVLAPQDVLASPPDLLHLLQEQAVNVVTLPPSVLQVLPQAELPSLRVVVAAGEACPVELAQTWGRERQFFNAYGPTETTVCASAALCDPRSNQAPPIGKPVFNTRLYVLDPHGEPLPAGIPGELYISGTCVARGYLNRPEMTEARFLPDPFQPGERMYRTGDRVRWRNDGELEFLGRLDQQVKLRGFRIELGEIETTLLQYPGIRQAVVILREDTPNDRRLAAYLVAEPGMETPGRSELRAFLGSRLPDYMIPPAYVFLDTLPLNPNGKIDRKQLPSPQQNGSGQVGTAPQTATEIELASICRSLLNVDQVYVEDNFFELGGHSLLATQFISQARERFQVDIPLRVLFEQPTIAALANYIDGAKPQDQTTHDSIAALLQLVEESDPEALRQILEKGQEEPLGGMD